MIRWTRHTKRANAPKQMRRTIPCHCSICSLCIASNISPFGSVFKDRHLPELIVSKLLWACVIATKATSSTKQRNIMAQLERNNDKVDLLYLLFNIYRFIWYYCMIYVSDSNNKINIKYISIICLDCVQLRE